MSSPRMSRFSRALGVLAVVWLAAVPAGEGRADPAEAERVRGAIEDALGSVQWPWKAGGEITVNEIGGAYHVIVPNVTLDPGQAFEAQSMGIFSLGDVSIIAKPLADDRYHVDITIPNRMSFREPGGDVAALITIGKQRFEGVWVPAFETFIEADAAYQDIWLTVPGSQPMMTLAALTMRVAMEEIAPGSWSGPSVSKFSQLRFEVPESGERLRIGEFEVRAYVDALRLGDWSRFMREMTGMIEQLQAQAGAAELDPAALLALLTDMPRLFSGVWSDMTISNLTAQDADGARVFNMDRMAMYFGVNGVDQDRAGAQFRYEHSGLDVAALEGVTKRVVPGDMTLEIEAVDLPTQALWEGIIEVIKSSAEMPPGLIQMMLLQRVTEAVFAASSGLNITKLNFDAPGINITCTGGIKADGESMHGVTGQFDATVRGLDTMIAEMSNAPEDENAIQIASALSLMQALGAAEPDQDGVSVRRYLLTIGADGQVLLNGNDLQAMLGPMMGQPAAP